MSSENLSNSINNFDNQPEKILGKQEIIEMLKKTDLDNSEMIDKLEEYFLKEKEKFEKINPETTETEIAFLMADVYFDAGYTVLAFDNISYIENVAKEKNDSDLLKRVEKVKNLMMETLRM